MSEILCTCATENEWLPEHYGMEHHPDCKVGLLPIIPPYAGQPRFDDASHLNITRTLHFPDWTGDESHTKEACERRFNGAFSFDGEASNDSRLMWAIEQLIESNPDIITRAVVKSVERRTEAGQRVRELLNQR